MQCIQTQMEPDSHETAISTTKASMDQLLTLLCPQRKSMCTASSSPLSSGQTTSHDQSHCSSFPQMLYIASRCNDM